MLWMEGRLKHVSREDGKILWVRKHLGEYHHLVQELKVDGDQFKEYFRMSRTQFEALL